MVDPLPRSARTGPDGVELILEEGGVHSFNFAIACDNGSTIMPTPLLLNTKPPNVCEFAKVSRIQRESQACMATVCSGGMGSRVACMATVCSGGMGSRVARIATGTAKHCV